MSQMLKPSLFPHRYSKFLVGTKVFTRFHKNYFYCKFLNSGMTKTLLFQKQPEKIMQLPNC